MKTQGGRGLLVAGSRQSKYRDCEAGLQGSGREKQLGWLEGMRVRCMRHGIGATGPDDVGPKL